MKTLLYTPLRHSLLALAIAGCLSAAETDKPKPDAPAEGESLVQLALLLDTSNSMDGLIEQAKTQLWKLVNEFNGAKQGDKVPVVQVALYEYGNNSLSAGSNYLRQILPLTRDLDKVSEELFKLSTNGGEEYCGAVIRHAMDSLGWDPSSQTYKAIFVAGNEPFTQGPVKADESCSLAIGKGIVVNTIHCGEESTGINGGWRKGAALAEGKHLNINQDKAVVHVAAPQDGEIAKLSIELNATYIAYGAQAAASVMSQSAQDKNAAASPAAGSSVQRALSKASANYCNTHWDLVDANKRAKTKLEDIPSSELPEQMRAMSPKERQDYVDAKAAERQRLQARIQELDVERRKYVAAHQAASGEKDTLDTAMASAIREQASARAKITFK